MNAAAQRADKANAQEADRRGSIALLLAGSERTTIVLALRLAAEQYDQDAAAARREAEAYEDGKDAGFRRLAAHFDQQAKDARAIVEWMEE